VLGEKAETSERLAGAARMSEEDIPENPIDKNGETTYNTRGTFTGAM
jgi:hypothetical protein